MKILKVFILILCIVAIVCIPISLFSDVSGKTIIGLIGYICLFVQSILNLIVAIYKKKTDKNKDMIERK